MTSGGSDRAGNWWKWDHPSQGVPRAAYSGLGLLITYLLMTIVIGMPRAFATLLVAIAFIGILPPALAASQIDYWKARNTLRLRQQIDRATRGRFSRLSVGIGGPIQILLNMYGVLHCLSGDLLIGLSLLLMSLILSFALFRSWRNVALVKRAKKGDFEGME